VSSARLELLAISKRFGSVHALRGADFVLQAGQVHALLGENGAGKSTLMEIAYGMIPADGGEIRIGGEAVIVRSPRDSRAHGVGMVHQHFTSVPALTVAENIQLAGGRAGAPGGGPSRVLDILWQGLDPSAPVEGLSVSLKQRLEIVKALSTGARILLLDEPTAVLAPPEVEELLRTIRAFAAEGGAVVLITHKLDEVFACADQVTVLRHGRVTFGGALAGQTGATLAAAMIGTASPPVSRIPVPAGPAADAPEIVRLSGVTIRPLEARGAGVRSGTLVLRAGEIVGVAALEGSGQRELLLAIAGLLRPTAGELMVRGRVALVPEDRTTEGLIPELTLTENVALALGADAAWVHGPWLDWAAAGRRTAELLPAFDVLAPGPDTPAGMLSGGNQQKLILARALEGHPDALVVENPTRGLDIRGTAAIHQRLREAAVAGLAVLVYSSDLDEVMQLGVRIVVMARGELREMPAGAKREEVGAAMLGLTTRSVLP
jgi:simple sugar transport system ATP-binding protein